MHYLIYKTTCTINGKYYVGKHKTKDRDDDYLGSGKLLLAAIEKYGRENFVREIILECSTEDEMNLAEKILVVPDIEVNYNLCPGGQGGWGYINTILDKEHRKNFGRLGGIKSALDKEIHHKRSSNGGKSCYAMYGNEKWIHAGGKAWTGQKHTDVTRQKMSISHQGKHDGIKNSQFGTRWMNDGLKNIKAKQDEIDTWIRMGYKLGRIGE